MTIAAANMANAIRAITIERGRDPRTASLMPFGGAGPLFATLLARELEIREIVVPPHAGNFSAWGLLGADLTQSAARTRIMRLTDGTVTEANAILAELFAAVEARSGDRGDRGGLVREIGLDMRYVGQEHTLTVEAPGDGRIDATAGGIREAFSSDYERTFGHVMDEEIEIVSLRATIRTALPRRAAESPGDPPAAAAPSAGTLAAWSFTRGERLPFAILDRAAIDADGVAGPAIILEPTATTYLDAEFTARRGPGGVLHLTDAKGA